MSEKPPEYNIVPGNFGESNENISAHRKEEIRIMAEKISAITEFLSSIEIDDNILKQIREAMSVFTGSMETDLLTSDESKWDERPEYFKRIVETFILENNEEMKFYLECSQ